MTMNATKARQTAIVWINAQNAIVASPQPDGGVATAKIDRGAEPEIQYLAHVVHTIGDRERVLIMGTSSARLALEREYVSINHRPDRLVPASEASAVEIAELLHAA